MGDSDDYQVTADDSTDFSGLGNIPVSTPSGGDTDDSTLNDATSSAILGQVRGLASFLTPFANNVVSSSSTPQQLQAANLAASLLNGSGPTDSSLAMQSPLSLLDFLTGSNSMPATAPIATSPATGSPSTITYIIIAGLVAVVAFIFLRR